jgi:hypothetical protein
MKQTLSLAPLACTLLLLAACDTLPGMPGKGTDASKPAVHNPANTGKPAANVAPTPAPVPPPPPVVPPDQLALKEGMAFYNDGDYANAIKRLTSPEIATGSKATQLAALKFSAFSYCVTSRTTLCRQQFEKAFKLDPAFDLAPGESGHPLWGPVFLKAKKTK